MGMYDILGKEEIKCFPVVVSFQDELWINHGTLTSYQKGDILPLSNFIYEYPQDFFIIDVSEKSFVHVIKNGKYEDTIYEKNKLKDLEYKNCFSCYGEKLEITSFSDVKKYEETMRLFFQQRILLYKEKRISEIPELKRELFKDFVNQEYQLLVKMGMYISVFMEDKSVSSEFIENFQEFWKEYSSLYPKYKARFSLNVQEKIDKKIEKFLEK